MRAMDLIKYTLAIENAESYSIKKMVETLKNMNATQFIDFFGFENSSLEECEINALKQFREEFYKMEKILEGFFNNGQMYILHKRDLFVIAIYEINEKSYKGIVHYNPLNVDCIEISIPRNQFENQFEKMLDVSNNENLIIEECNELIKKITKNE